MGRVLGGFLRGFLFPVLKEYQKLFNKSDYLKDLPFKGNLVGLVWLGLFWFCLVLNGIMYGWVLYRCTSMLN